MKLIYIGKEKYTKKLKSLFVSNNIEVIHYRNPIKAIDNFEEIEPDIIYFKKDDFPRLWKITLSGLREKFDKISSHFLLEGNLINKEIEEFEFLKGTIYKDHSEKLIEEIKTLADSSLLSENIYYPEENELNIGFVNPEDYSFLSADIIEISEKNITIKIEDLENIDLKEDTIINDASLSYNDEVININFKILSINSSIKCELIEISEDYTSLTHSLFV